MSAPALAVTAATGSGLDLAIETRTLANGLTVVLLPDRRLPLVALELRLDAGAWRDPDDASGLAHLVEHLLLTGREVDSDLGRGPSFPALTQTVGGWSSGSTAHDHVALRDLLPAAELPLGLWLAAERLAAGGADWLTAQLDTQRRVILQERRQTHGGTSPARLHEVLQGLLYPEGHAYGRSTVGTPEGLAAATPERVRDFVATRVRPESAVLAIAGDVDPDLAWRQIEATLGGRSGGSAATGGSRDEIQEPPPALTATTASRRPISTAGAAPGAAVALRGPGFARDGWHATALWVAALSSGVDGPLYRAFERRAPDLARRLEGRLDGRLLSMRSASTAVFTARVHDGETASSPGDVEHLAEALTEALVECLEQRPDAETLGHARRRLLVDHLGALQHLVKRVAVAARLAADLGAPERIRTEVERYRGTTLDDLERVGAELARPEHRARLMIRPAAPGSRA